jgi:hypothetical protein
MIDGARKLVSTFLVFVLSYGCSTAARAEKPGDIAARLGYDCASDGERYERWQRGKSRAPGLG